MSGRDGGASKRVLKPDLEWPLREIMNAIFYVLRGGIAWRLLPREFPPRTTVYRWFALWRDTGLKDPNGITVEVTGP